MSDQSRKYVPTIEHKNDALCMALYDSGATEADVIDALVKDRARLIVEHVRYKEKCAMPVVYRIVEDPK